MDTEFETMFRERSPKQAFIIDKFRDAIGKEHVDFCDINTLNMRRFKNYLEQRVCANSIRAYTATFGAYIRECVSDGFIGNAKCLSALKVKKIPQQNVALNEEEVQRLYDYYINLEDVKKNYNKKCVLTLFLIECYCGARGCDVEQFTPNNLKDGMLSYVSQKTKVLTIAPAHKYLESLIKNIAHKKYNRATKNRIIKQACKVCHIDNITTIFYHGKTKTAPKYEFVGCHTARRSYVSNLLDRGVPIVSVSKFAGHEDLKTTQRYYCSDKIQLDDNLMAFFR